MRTNTAVLDSIKSKVSTGFPMQFKSPTLVWCAITSCRTAEQPYFRSKLILLEYHYIRDFCTSLSKQQHTPPQP